MLKKRIRFFIGHLHISIEQEVMKTPLLKIFTTIFASIAAFACASVWCVEQSGNGMLVWGFIGLTAVILSSQAAPAVVVFFSMVKDLFFGIPSEVSLSIMKSKSNNSLCLPD